MSFEYECPESLDSGNFVKTPGWFHMTVLNVEEKPTSKKGELLDGFRVDCSVLDGTPRVNGVCTERTKTHDIMFFNGKLTDKNEGEFARQKQGKFFKAVGLLDDSAKGKKVSINLADAIGRQFVCQLEHDDAGKYLQLAFAEVYHVDDPAVAHVPKCEKSLKAIPKKQRLIGEQGKAAAKPAEAKTEAAPAETPAATSTALAGLDDI